MKSFEPIEYNKTFEHLLTDFLEQRLPESSRTLDINGRHSCYKDTEKHFKTFLCMFDGENIIGTAAVTKLNGKSCDLKSLYLPDWYHGTWYGKCLLREAIACAK